MGASMDQMIQKLRQDAEKKVQQIQKSRESECRRVIEKEQERAKKKSLEIASQYEKQISQEKFRHHLQVEHHHSLALLEEKSFVANKVLESVLTSFKEEPFSIYLQRLCLCLETAIEKNKGEIPVINVPENRFSEVSNALEKSYPIEVDPQVKVGFLFSFSHFNYNYDIAQMIAYRRDRLEREIQEIVFSEKEDGI